MRLARLPRLAPEGVPPSQPAHSPRSRLDNLELSRWCFTVERLAVVGIFRGAAGPGHAGSSGNFRRFLPVGHESSKLSAKTPPGAGVGNIGIGE